MATDHMSKASAKRLKFVGASSRSRNGCLSCKSKRKKCDEIKPICGLCQRIKSTCDWPVVRPKVTTKSVVKLSRLPINNKINIHDPSHNKSAHPSKILDNELNLFLVESLFEQDDYTVGSTNHDVLDPLTKAFINKYHEFQLTRNQPLCYIPESFSLGNGEEVMFLEYFVSSIATNISTVPNESNYYLNFYLPMAVHDEALLNALISWGGIFLNAQQGRAYLEQSASLLNDKLNNMKISSLKAPPSASEKQELMKALVCANALLAVEISAGDVKNWQVFFQICELVIKRLGGINNLLHDREEKILVSNFAFHDLLGLRSMCYGTRFSIDEYQLVYHHGIQYIDSLQGCVGPLFLIIGEIFQESRKFRKLLYSKGQTESAYNPLLSNKEKLTLLHELDTTTKYFEKRILQSEPRQIEIDYYKSISHLEHHLAVYKLYQNISLILTKQFLKKMSPESPDVQLLVLECNQLLDQLVLSPVKGLLCFAFVVIGLNSTTAADRAEYINRVDLIKIDYKIANFDRAIAMIRHSWEHDATDDCIHKKLFGILQRLDWNLSLV